jgi:hypothetical protein
VEFVPGEKASRFIEILNNVKADKRTFEAPPKKSNLQLNFKKPVVPDLATSKQQAFSDSDSLDRQGYSKQSKQSNGEENYGVLNKPAQEQ